jgi:hypothetical protein
MMDACADWCTQGAADNVRHIVNHQEQLAQRVEAVPAVAPIGPILSSDDEPAKPLTKGPGAGYGLEPLSEWLATPHAELFR